MLVRLLRNGVRPIMAQAATAQAVRSLGGATNQIRYNSTAAAPYFELEVVDGIAVVRMDQPNRYFILDGTKIAL